MSTVVPTIISTVKTDVFDRELDRLFDDALRVFGASAQTWAPASNAWEDEHGFTVEVALPGWDPKDIALEVEHQVLTVKGDRKNEPAASATYHLREIPGGRFTRLFRLPNFVDQECAAAVHKNGLLTITFPKREEAKPRRIMIEGQ